MRAGGSRSGLRPLALSSPLPYIFLLSHGAPIRAERLQADPSNLIRVMPAEG
jgi:hypothetical protein